MPPFGSTQEKIGYSILLDHDGKTQDAISLSDPDGQEVEVDGAHGTLVFKRSGISPPPFFLWDKTAFVLGVEQKAGSDSGHAKPQDRGAAFKALHLDRLADATDEGLASLRKFY